MKKGLLFFLAIILILSSVPAFAQTEATYTDTIGGLAPNKFVTKYCLGGAVTPASGTLVGTGSTMTRDGKDYTVIVRGDINGDGRIQSVDYLKIKKHFAGQALSELESLAADVNRDNEIKSVDYLKIKSYMKGMAELWSADSYVGERYMGFRIWNHTWHSTEDIRNVARKAKEHGFNMINLHSTWYNIEQTAGNIDYSKLDAMIDAIIEEGLKVTAIIEISRIYSDGYLNPEDFALSTVGKRSGNDNQRCAPSFCSENAVSKGVAFYREFVKHLDEKYGQNIVLYLPCVSSTCELEYTITSTFDYSDFALAQYKDFAAARYGTIEAYNTAMGSSVKSFDDVVPPNTHGTSNTQLLWYQFKQEKLKQFVDKLCDVTHEVNPDAKICVQTGSVGDVTANNRATIDIAYVAEKADAVWIDDGPLQNHKYRTEYLRCAVGRDIEIGNEIDGPTGAATEELDIAQGNISYESGAKYVVCANWGSPDSRGWSNVWYTLRDNWLGEGPHEVSEINSNSPMISVSLYDLFRKGDVSYEGFANKNARYEIVRDLTDYVPEKNVLRTSYPTGYSGVQGANGWKYYLINKGIEMPLTFTNNRWMSGDAYIIDNVVMPGRKADAMLAYTCTKDGDAAIDFGFGTIEPFSSGIGVKILVNDTQVYPEGTDYLTVKSSGLSDVITYSLAKGDVVKFAFNSLGDNTGDQTFVRINIDY